LNRIKFAYHDIHKQDLSNDFMDFKKVNEDVDKKTSETTFEERESHSIIFFSIFYLLITNLFFATKNIGGVKELVVLL